MTQWGLDTLFNPAKRHMDEEKRRLQSTREEVGDNSGGKRIDLESGKVTIRRDDDADVDGAEDATAGAAAAPEEQTAPARRGSVKDESPAMQRARLRRAQRAGKASEKSSQKASEPAPGADSA